eukprot:COSAG04_NODE_674_length_11272_cov_8.036248_13_plen_213_part_00
MHQAWPADGVPTGLFGRETGPQPTSSQSASAWTLHQPHGTQTNHVLRQEHSVGSLPTGASGRALALTRRLPTNATRQPLTRRLPTNTCRWHSSACATPLHCQYWPYDWLASDAACSPRVGAGCWWASHVRSRPTRRAYARAPTSVQAHEHHVHLGSGRWSCRGISLTLSWLVGPWVTAAAARSELPALGCVFHPRTDLLPKLSKLAGVVLSG